LSGALKPNRLTFISAWYSLELLARSVDAEKRAIQPHLDLLKAMGCTVCIACETSNAIHGAANTPLSAKPVLAAEDWAGFGARVEEIAAFTAAQGLQLVYHHHMGTVVQTQDEIDCFMNAAGPMTRLLFDTGHCHFGGGDPAAVLARHASRVAHFHAKNVRPEVMHRVRRDDLTFLDAVRLGVFTVPGDPDGIVDFLACLSILTGARYDGWLVIEAEQDPSVRNPKEYQTMGLDSLRTMAAEAGLSIAA
jgi:inosose dehydratase